MTPSTYKTMAPAKLNIHLKITGRRPDGYHELISIMVPIDLFDLLEITVTRERRIDLFCEGVPVPVDESNLVFRAASSFLSETGFQKGVSLKLSKRIPVSAGMGGGSSDAAATLLSLNEMWGRPLSLEKLHDFARQLGADVPFFLYCKPALATGIGDVLEPLRSWPRFWYVIITPALEISTSWVYGNLKLNQLTTGEEDYISKKLSFTPIDISKILENDLETVTSARFPIIDTTKKALLEAGAEGALMTGSGPSVFGVFRSLTQAESAKKHLISQNLGDVFVATNWERE